MLVVRCVFFLVSFKTMNTDLVLLVEVEEVTPMVGGPFWVFFFFLGVASTKRDQM